MPVELMLGEEDEYALRADGRMDQHQLPIPQTYAEAARHPLFGFWVLFQQIILELVEN